EPNVFLDKFGQNSIDFELVVWSSDMSARPRRYRSDLNFAIEEKLREAGIEIPNPQRDLHFRGGVLKVETVAAQDRHVGSRNSWSRACPANCGRLSTLYGETFRAS